MSIENSLQETLKEGGDDARLKRQLGNFQRFEKRLAEGGLEIERKSFTIPLMERLSCAWLR